MAPTVGARTLIDSPGFAQMASYSRSRSASISCGGRRGPTCSRFGAVAAGRPRLFAEAKARSRAAVAAARPPATKSSTKRSICCASCSALMLVTMLAGSHQRCRYCNRGAERLRVLRLARQGVVAPISHKLLRPKEQ